MIAIFVYTLKDIIGIGILAITILAVVLVGIGRLISKIGDNITKKRWEDKEDE